MKRKTAYNSTFAIGGVLCFYESEVLNSSFKYRSVNNSPTFGHSQIENLLVFQKLTNAGLIERSGTHHLDCFDFVRTEKGEKYLTALKDKISK